MVAKRVVEVPVALIVGEIPNEPPPPMGRPEPTDEETIAQLRADLLAERAWSMRLVEYIDEVLDEAVPDDEAIAGWEGHDWREYWS